MPKFLFKTNENYYLFKNNRDKKNTTFNLYSSYKLFYFRVYIFCDQISNKLYLLQSYFFVNFVFSES